MKEVEIWLRSRPGEVPPTLLERMVDALPDDADSIPDGLVRGALGLYASVARGTGRREDALPLLAADALLTHAFEAQAELAPGSIQELVARCELALGEVLP